MKNKLLIVDDALTILSILENVFYQDYEVIKKNNGKEALDWIEEGNIPDIIIVDVNMPVMGGYEFISLIKKCSFFFSIPIFVLSNADSSSEKIKFLKLGVNDYVLKPFNPEELYWKITNLSKRIHLEFN